LTSKMDSNTKALNQIQTICNPDQQKRKKDLLIKSLNH
jgi:hypothetical protein